MDHGYLESIRKQFRYYKQLGDKAMQQVPADRLFWAANEDSNSIAVIVNHMSGNMLSRWTDFLNSDGEKDWRNRDREFESVIETEAELWARWNEGWDCLFTAIDPLTSEDLGRLAYIRNQGHTVVEAINRQLAHYAYHVGQIVFLGKMLAEDGWESLSIPKGGSKAFNDKKFSEEKKRGHFTDDFLEPDGDKGT